MLEKISIIVPIYNSENTLNKCVKSILSQSYKYLEVILINDGSTDESLKICEKFGLEDVRVIVINKERLGVSAARNVGIKVATGKYIQFVDADDYIDCNMTQILYENIDKNNADIVICGYNKINGDNVVKKTPNNYAIERLFNFKDCFTELYRNAFFNATWNKLYRKEKIKTGFNETISMGEDLLFNLSYISDCDKISVINKNLYNYNVSSQESLVCQYNNKLFKTEAMLHNEVQKFFKNSFDSDNFCDINEVFAKEVYYYLKKLVILSDEVKEIKLKKIKSCFEDEFVKNMLYNVNLSDNQIKIVCALMKLKLKRFIYTFFKFKNFLNKNNLR